MARSTYSQENKYGSVEPGGHNYGLPYAFSFAHWATLTHRFLLALMVCVGVVGCSGVSPEAKQLLGHPAPVARLYLMDGTEVPLDGEQGRNVMIIFWATWCSHSRGAIEEFEALAKKYKRRKDITFLAISVDRAEDYEALKSRISEQDLHSMTHAFSGNDVQDEAYDKFHGHALPYVVAIDPRGIVRVVDSDVSSLQGYISRITR